MARNIKYQKCFGNILFGFYDVTSNQVLEEIYATTKTEASRLYFNSWFHPMMVTSSESSALGFVLIGEPGWF